MKVVKRNGDVVPFDSLRIEKALMKAFCQMREPFDTSVTEKIVSKIKTDMNVEQIQDIVVKTLMATKYKDVALAYQTYRVLREDGRLKEEKLYRQVEGIFQAKDLNILNENTNKDSKTISVQRDLLAGVTSKEYYLNKVLPKKIANAHIEGRVHIHDLDYLVAKETNCEVFDLARMLKGGCKIGNAEMSEPNGLEVAVGHAVQIVASISSNTFGGCSLPYFDKDLVPYVRKTMIKHYKNGLKYIEPDKDKTLFNIENEDYFSGDWGTIRAGLKSLSPLSYAYALDLTKEAVKQAVQGFEYEINSLSTINGQAPFTTIGLGTETTMEGVWIQEEVLKQRKGGFGKDKKNVVVFPKIVFAVCDEINFNEDSPNYHVMQLAAECMTKSIYPDILFVSKEEVDQEEVIYPMGCRAFLSSWHNETGKSIVKGRGNLGATTINLPRIALKHRGNVEGFYRELDEVLDICKENSLFRINYLKGMTSDVAPILWQSGALLNLKKGEEVKGIFENGYMTISIGFIGLSEVSEILFGENFAIDSFSYEKSKEIIQYISDKVALFKKETGVGFALYSTPSESLCKRFEEIDKKDFGIIEGITDKGYYDNSFHVSSRININPFKKLKLEAPFHKMATGGHISYIESDSLKKNQSAVIDILRYGKSVGIHYMGINQPVDSCHKCGFEGEFSVDENGFHCPNCGNKDSETINVIRRVCGYLSQPDDRPFNVGKQKEVIGRVKHL